MQCALCGITLSTPSSVCPSCGGTLEGFSAAHLLPLGAELFGGMYVIGGVLGQGGFGITYEASDRALGRQVAVKEYFPEGCMRVGGEEITLGRWAETDYREARGRFLDEARTLARFSHPGIVRVFNAFEQNRTAYMAMELLKGKTLKSLIEEDGRAFSEAEAVGLVREAGRALEAVHQAGLLHRDVKPDNLMLTEEGRIVLIDFGLAKEFITGATQSHSLTLTPGFAPLEQYALRAKRGPFTDVYALAATLYYLLAGEEPPSSTDRAAGVDLVPPRRLRPEISPTVSQAVVRGMAMRVEERPQAVGEFLSALSGASSPAEVPPLEIPPPPKETQKPPSEKKREPDEEEPSEQENLPGSMELEFGLACCGMAVLGFLLFVFVAVMLLATH
jgi:serine/threonine protein kinase